MPYQTITSNYFFSNWYEFFPKVGRTENRVEKNYQTLGVYSQGTNWEKIFEIGNQINKDTQMTEQDIIDEVTRLRRQKSV
jgi:hypothetical protein